MTKRYAFPTVPIASTIAAFYAFNPTIWVAKPRGRHMGVDLSARGAVPVHAVAGGIVMQSGFFRPGTSFAYPGGYGRHVLIEHGGFQTLYAHLAGKGPSMELDLEIGSLVDAGDVIGHMGGDLSDKYRGASGGHHLHVECILRNKPEGWQTVETPRGWCVDPLAYLSAQLCEPAIMTGTVMSWNGVKVRAMPTTNKEGIVLGGVASKKQVQIVERIMVQNGKHVDVWVRLRSLRDEWAAALYRGTELIRLEFHATESA